MLSRRHFLRMTQMGVTNTPLRGIGEIEDVPQYRRNALYVNRGDGTYAEVACWAGLEASEWTWTAAFLDADLDGYEDLFLGTGHAFDTQDLDTMEAVARLGKQSVAESRKNLFLFPALPTPNFIFRHQGDLRFEETGAAWGFASTQVTHGMAFGDLDGDGDLDVVLNCLNAPALLYRNNSPAPRLAVRLKGRPPNTQGIGARIVVRGGAVPMQSQEMTAGGRYLSGDEALRVFAAGQGERRRSIEVRWRSGARSMVEGVRADYLYEIEEPVGTTKVEGAATEPPRGTWFADDSDRLGHRHHEAPFDDFAVQPLLYRRLSQLGPGVAWVDVDRDGHEDLVVGAGRGGVLAVYRGDGRGGWTAWKAAGAAAVQREDVLGMAAFGGADGETVLLAARARWETGFTHDAVLLRVGGGSGGEFKIEEVPFEMGQASPGPVAVADVDGDGDLDVFIGGRAVPGRYPEPAESRLLLNEEGRLRAASPQPWLPGLVSGAVFTDLDGDGWAELVVAEEWGPLRVYRNTGGALSEATNDWGLGSLRGWWNSVGAGDFDGDGRMDLIAGNWGLNSLYHASPEHPVRLYSGDFDGDGTWDLLEARFDAESGQVVPHRDMLVVGGAMPVVRARFGTHQAYAKAGVAEVLGEARGGARELWATELASVVCLNRGGRFEVRRLPDEAQFSAAFGVAVADFDGDGAEDVFVAQNLFALRADEVRLDAGRGLVLRGDGRGGFWAVPGQETGVKVYGEQRGAATADFDEDGRPDLVVTQNGAATRVFRNERGRPGLRVNLRGPVGNQRGVGAQLWLEFEGGAGPVRELHGGGGYGSQDGLTVVLATPSVPRHLKVRWPGGRTTTHAVAPGSRELTATGE